jgi:hypothetical protein
MKNIGHFLLIPFFIISIHSACAQVTGLEETNKLILEALNSGNSSDLSKYFNSMIDLGITGTEDTYSKNHASRILQDFFKKYPVRSVNILKQGTSNDGSQFSIGEMVAGNKNFRIYYLLKKVTARYLIQQLQIEEEN